MSSSSSIQPRWTSSGGPCAACKHLRRKCQPDCIFAPYFPSSNTEEFSVVHSIFGASNAAKILRATPVPLRQMTVSTLVFEARERCKNVVCGASKHIIELRQCLAQLEQKIQQLEQINQQLEQKIQQMHFQTRLIQRDGFPNQNIQRQQHQTQYRDGFPNQDVQFRWQEHNVSEITYQRQQYHPTNQSLNTGNLLDIPTANAGQPVATAIASPITATASCSHHSSEGFGTQF